jgi:hypothetical protein
MTLRQKLEDAINSVSAENGSNTPDYILADYLMSCLAAYDCATVRRDEWYGVTLRPGKLIGRDVAPSPAANNPEEK